MRGRPIPGLKKYQRRNSGGYFEDLPWPLKRKAQDRLWHLCQKWKGDLPGWRLAILVGRAKDLTLHPRGYEWSRWMNAKKGGYAVRHTFLTRLGASGCDAWTLARIAGHSSVAISARYVHPSEDSVLAAVEKLGGHKTGHSEEKAEGAQAAEKFLTA